MQQFSKLNDAMNNICKIKLTAALACGMVVSDAGALTAITKPMVLSYVLGASKVLTTTSEDSVLKRKDFVLI